MRQDPLLASIGGMLQKCRRAEAWLRQAGLPIFFARLPVWGLCLHYCFMMTGKTRRISRIAERITRWMETITGLSNNEKARLELLDMDLGMRSDIESTKRTLQLLRELSVDVGALFDSIGYQSLLLARTQAKFMDVVDDACTTATRLQRALEMHDARALALLREMEEHERGALRGSEPAQTLEKAQSQDAASHDSASPGLDGARSASAPQSLAASPPATAASRQAPVAASGRD